MTGAGPQVGVSAIVLRDGAVLLGLRRGAHGADTWAPPGGKVDHGEDPSAAVARELHEETGLLAERVEPVTWTNDVFAEGLHFVTLHHLVRATGDPVVVEPDKVSEWRWWPWAELPQPLFPAFASLLDTGWTPRAS